MQCRENENGFAGQASLQLKVYTDAWPAKQKVRVIPSLSTKHDPISQCVLSNIGKS